MAPRAHEARLRRRLLVLAAAALGTTVVELWLVNHLQQPLQVVPWLLCALGLLALGPAILRPSKGTLTALCVIMPLVALGGLVGIVVHLTANLEFQQAIHPTVGGADLLLPALKGAAPLLAPGALIFAALLALAAAVGHPMRTPGSPLE